MNHDDSAGAVGIGRGQAAGLLAWMSGVRLRALLFAVLALLTLTLAEAMRPRQNLADMRPKVDLEVVVPRAFGEWVIDDRQPVKLVSPDTQALLNRLYSQVLERIYVHTPTGRRVMLSIAYGGDQSDAGRAHRPEVCYPAQGYDISGRQTVQWQMGDRALPVGQLVARLGSRQEPISYWFVVGEYIAISGSDQKLTQLRYGMRGIVPDGMLVRISSVDPDISRAYGVHEEFARGMLAGMTPQQRLRLAGGGG
jgi:EpsI family protein